MPCKCLLEAVIKSALTWLGSRVKQGCFFYWAPCFHPVFLKLNWRWLGVWWELTGCICPTGASFALWELTVFSFGLQRTDRLKSWNWKVWRKSVPWPARASPWLSTTPRRSRSQVGVGRPQQALGPGRRRAPRACGARRRHPGHSPRARLWVPSFACRVGRTE